MDEKLSRLGLSRGSFPFSRLPWSEGEASIRLVSAFLISSKALFAYTVNAIVVITAIMKEIMLYMISTVVRCRFPYLASANVLINRPLHKSTTNIIYLPIKRQSSFLLIYQLNDGKRNIYSVFHILFS
jgi:hypothetical protein